MGIFDIFKKKKKDVVKEIKINESLKEIIQSLQKNEIRINLNTHSAVKTASSSKIGGKPYLPKTFSWPVFTSYEDNITRPLSFICQINLKDLEKYDIEGLLPKNGMLYFFYECESCFWGFNPKDNGAAKVYYYDDLTNFEEIDIPTSLEKHNIVPEISISFENKVAYPQYEEFYIHTKLGYDFEEYDLILENLGIDLDEEDINKLLGYANILQNEMLTECESVSRGINVGDSKIDENTTEIVYKDIENKANQWVLLFQIGTISKGGFEMMFGDCGYLYFYVKKEDLINKNFNNIQFIVQCF